MNTKTPKSRDNIVCNKLGDSEYAFYDPNKDKLHIMNETAFFVWGFCDGAHTKNNIEAELRKKYDISDSRNLSEDIENILKLFEKEGLFR